MTDSEPPAHVLEESSGRRVRGAELGERVALEHRDPTGDEERHPHRRTCNLAGRAQEREDPGADHGADTDERSLANRVVPSDRRLDLGRLSHYRSPR